MFKRKNICSNIMMPLDHNNNFNTYFSTLIFSLTKLISKF